MALRPTPPSRTLIVAYSALRSCSSTHAHTSLARCPSGSTDSRSIGRNSICLRLGIITRTLPATLTMAASPLGSPAAGRSSNNPLLLSLAIALFSALMNTQRLASPPVVGVCPYKNSQTLRAWLPFHRARRGLPSRLGVGSPACARRSVLPPHPRPRHRPACRSHVQLPLTEVSGAVRTQARSAVRQQGLRTRLARTANFNRRPPCRPRKVLAPDACNRLTVRSRPPSPRYSTARDARHRRRSSVR